MNNAFFSELLTSIIERSRTLLRRRDGAIGRSTGAISLVDLCNRLLSGGGEATAVAIARELLDRYGELDDQARFAFFENLAENFGANREDLKEAVEAWCLEPSEKLAADIHFVSEPRRQELFRRLNRAPGGTAAIVRMREHILGFTHKSPGVSVVDRDLVHLLGSWFNRGFLVLKRIDWSTPALILEKIIRYEAVHEISDWAELQRRIAPIDRRCHAFFHPAMVDEPLIFVEVALTNAIPAEITPLLADGRQIVAPEEARTAVFYSISNCQRGLGGISFGNFLIKQVVEDLRLELPKLERFVTLSPVPGFMSWMKTYRQDNLGAPELALLATLDSADESDVDGLRHLIEPLAARYLLEARKSGRPLDPVARFHLGNGARLERINWLGDRSEKALREAAGLMVNYLYDLDEIEKNHEAYANRGEIIASAQVRKLWKLENTAKFTPPAAVARQT